MTDLTERLRAWAVRGKLLQPYEVKPLLREAATTLETLTQENARLREALIAQHDWHYEKAKALSKQPQTADVQWRRDEHREQIDVINVLFPAEKHDG